MAIYSIWNNKGGVGKSYLTFQIASEYAVNHPDKKILVIDLCPQGNASGMLLGGMQEGERVLKQLNEPISEITKLSKLFLSTHTLMPAKWEMTL